MDRAGLPDRIERYERLRRTGGTDGLDTLFTPDQDDGHGDGH